MALRPHPTTEGDDLPDVQLLEQIRLAVRQVVRPIALSLEGRHNQNMMVSAIFNCVTAAILKLFAAILKNACHVVF